MIKKIKQRITIVISSLLFTQLAFSGTQIDYSTIINSSKKTCLPPLESYVNDDVILGGNATFEEFIAVFPSNHEHYLKMFHSSSLQRINGDYLYCSGRYSVSRNEMEKIMNHWTSLFTQKNAIQWYQITLSNLAGPFQIDNYPLLAQAMWNTLDKENLMLQLTALKTLPLSTQKILVNAYKLSPTDALGSHGDRFLFTIKGIDTEEECKDEYCSYLQTLVDDKFKTIGHN
ncbi:hypothetical protein GNP80_20520 [Aliivibrio fischeri]|uniref:hypothetical protein n=1 Tax=Aliivibrio fischeri TaxID=668 RepID=UPI0012DAAA29|nr:hypothetical protein [Aliivibrio fischeri]MUK94794.1 hypothetical protein [Aliivibrio fischeri]